MRAKWRWLHIVALAALIFGAAPVGALATLCQPVRCSMPCCTHADSVAAEEGSQDTVCPDHPASPADLAASIQTIKPKATKPSPCNCSIKSKGGDETERNLPATTTGFKTPEVVAVFVLISSELGLPQQVTILPGVYASDSGPPETLASLPWLGRAPPFLA